MGIGKDFDFNAVSGNGMNMMREQRRVERRIDKETAVKKAFGESIGEQNIKQLEYEAFLSAIKSIRSLENSTESKTRFSLDLINLLSKKLQLDRDLIKIFNTTGTPLDKYHKASAFVDIAESLTEESRVIAITLDVFTEDKNRRYCADINFKMPKLGFDNPSEEYTYTLEDVALRIIEKFRNLKHDVNVRYRNTESISLKNGKVVDFRKKAN